MDSRPSVSDPSAGELGASVSVHFPPLVPTVTMPIYPAGAGCVLCNPNHSAGGGGAGGGNPGGKKKVGAESLQHAGNATI